MGNCGGSLSTEEEQSYSPALNGNEKPSIFTQEQDHFFKVLLLGDSGVGKSSLLMRLTDNRFVEQHTSTVGVDFRSTNLVVDSQNVNLQIWDTAGQERYRSITTAYYRGAHGVFLIFDITQRDTFINIHKWLADVHRHSHDRTQIMLIGNKKDLESARAVTFDEATETAKNLGLTYTELSAKEEYAEDVSKAFTEMTRRILVCDSAE